MHQDQISKPYKPVVAELLNEEMPQTILDAPSGSGWLVHSLNYHGKVDALDFYHEKPEGYRFFYKSNLDEGLPEDLPCYDFIVCCEGIEHIGNPISFIKTLKKHLNKKGGVIITTPNIWYPEAKLQFLLKGFFPGFPCIVDRIQHGSHMHITPYSFPQLYLYLKLCGFRDIRLHNTTTKKPKHFFEKVLGFPQLLYCHSKLKKTKNEEVKLFWKYSGSEQSVYGRNIIVSAKRND